MTEVSNKNNNPGTENSESKIKLVDSKMEEMITILKNIDDKLTTISRAIREINARG
jgi:hypothetical protein